MTKKVSDDTLPLAVQLREYIQSKPYVLEAMELGIVNQTQLARQACQGLGTQNLVAIKAALRRYASLVSKDRKMREAQVARVLKESSISVQDIAVAISAGESQVKDKIRLKFDDAVIYACDRSNLKSIKSQIKSHPHATMFIISSPRNIEQVPGVVAYLASLLAREGINVLEFASAWVYTVFIVDKQDSARTYDLLRKVVG